MGMCQEGGRGRNHSAVSSVQVGRAMQDSSVLKTEKEDLVARTTGFGDADQRLINTAKQCVPSPASSKPDVLFCSSGPALGHFLVFYGMFSLSIFF